MRAKKAALHAKGRHPKGRQVADSDLAQISALLSAGNLEPRAHLLIEHLHSVYDRFGELSKGHMAALAEHIKLSQVEVFEVASFYDRFFGKEVDLPLKAWTQNAIEDLPPPQHLESYRKRGGYQQLEKIANGSLSSEDVIAAIETSGLQGMGGAGFPTGRKWRFIEEKPKPRALVVNADEGEPGTFKDRFILEQWPHRVLEGALIAAHALQADDIYIYLRAEYPKAREILQHALLDVSSAGLDKDINIHLRQGAGSYVCGEETALLESLEGKRGLPRNRPPFPAENGLFGRPTVVDNVETLYWVAEIIERGAKWYAEQGHPRFYTVSGRVKQPGVKLAPAATTARQLIEDFAGGMADGHSLNAFLPGGASGGIFPARLGDTEMGFGKFEAYGGFVGSGALIVLSDRDDPWDVARELAEFFAFESCGQCTPCRIGTEKLCGLLKDPKANRAIISELAKTMADASICGLGQAAPNPALTLLNLFDQASEK